MFLMGVLGQKEINIIEFIYAFDPQSDLSVSL